MSQKSWFAAVVHRGLRRRVLKHGRFLLTAKTLAVGITPAKSSGHPGIERRMRVQKPDEDLHLWMLVRLTCNFEDCWRSGRLAMRGGWVVLVGRL